MRLHLLTVAALLVGCGPKLGTGIDAGTLPVVLSDAGVDAGYPEPFALSVFKNTRITSISSEPNFQKADAEFDWGTSPKARVRLLVDLTSTCFPFEKWQTNPPPPGHNWPADCDAFDRNFEFILDPPQSPGDPPGIELVRSITPFGGPQQLVLDITDVANARPGKHTLRTTITTWSDSAGQVSGSAGGWNVSAELLVEPGLPPRSVLALIPLYNGSQTTTGDGPELPFTLPAGTKTARLEYRTTGHGGGAADSACIGPAEEFCQRTHRMFADGQQLSAFTPWRDDCDDLCTTARHNWPGGGSITYCVQNPCGSMQSVRAPRANWCPGSMTPPMIFEAPAWQSPGAHSAKWSIARIASGGSWRISAHVFAYGD